MNLETKTILVLDMSCAVCANNVESTVKHLSGVVEAAVNFAANTLTVKYDPQIITLQKMQEAVQAAGYDLVIESEDPLALQQEMERKHYAILKRNVAGAWLFSVALLLLSMFCAEPLWSKVEVIKGSAYDVVVVRGHFGVRTFVLCEWHSSCPKGESEYGYTGDSEYCHCFFIQFV